MNALQDEAFPIVHIDNILITYEDGHVLKIEDGSEADGHFLQSDVLGHTEWYDLRSEMDQKINDNQQDLTFDTTQNALFIENGNGVLISSLKNNNGKALQLSGSQIEASVGMSLHLPSINSNFSSLYFNAENGAMDWGIYNSTTKGLHSTRWGFDTKATNTYSSAWGHGSLASGISSTAYGVYNTSSGDISTSWGNVNFSTGFKSTSWGSFNEASSENSTSFGHDNTSSGELSTSWGRENQSIGLKSTTWGEINIASGQDATAWGFNNTASGGKGYCMW